MKKQNKNKKISLSKKDKVETKKKLAPRAIVKKNSKKSPRTSLGKKKEKVSLGGMALANGLMFRSKKAMALAVVDEAGRIEVFSSKIKDTRKHFAFLFFPFIRGITFLVESVYFWLRMLFYRAPITKREKKLKLKHRRFFDSISGFFVSLIYILVFIGFFDYLYTRLELISAPGFIPIIYSFLFTILYIALFIVLFALIVVSRKGDIDFLAYHSIEHRIVNLHERGEEVNIKNIKSANEFHRRCGIAVFFWSIVLLSFLINIFEVGSINWAAGMFVSLAIIFLSFSIAYEFVKISIMGKKEGTLFALFIKPLYILQGLLVHEPDEDHIRAGIAAYNTVIELDREQS